MANDIGKNLLGAVPPPRHAEPVSRLREHPSDRSEQATATIREQEGASEVYQEPRPVEEVVSGLNEMVQNLHRNLQFSVDDQSGETVIKVVDSETQEVLRQIPSDEIMRLRQHMQDAAGVLFRGVV